MMNLDRLLIKDEQNNLYKLFTLVSKKDSRNEPFIKICYPKTDGSGVLYDINKTSKITDSYYDQFNREDKDISEFSYHFLKGVSHFKYKINHYLQLRNLPTIKQTGSYNTILFHTINIFDLKNFEIYKKDTQKHDFILPTIFKEKNGRILHLYLDRMDEKIVYSEKEDEDANLCNHLGTYDFIDTNSNIRLTLIDHEFKNKPLNVGAHYHRPLDPYIKKFIKITKQNYKEEFEQIKEKFIKHDPYSLIKDKIYKNQYDYLIKKLIPKLLLFKTESELYGYLYSTSSNINEDGLKLIVKSIWKRYINY